MLTALALLAARALTPSDALTVETARAAAARLGAALGRTVEVARPLADVPVLVDAPGLAPDDVLRALALALHASLVVDGKTLRLERTATDRKAVMAAHFAVNRDRIAKGLTDEGSVLARADRLGDAAHQVRAARSEVAQAHRAAEATRSAGHAYIPPSDLLDESVVLPVGRLLHGLLARLGPDRLATIDPGGTLFFSDRPNAVESPLPADGDLVAAYAAAQEGYANAMGLPAPAGPPAKVVVRATEFGAGIDVYDARGRRLDRVWKYYAFGPILVPGTVASPTDLAPRWLERDATTRRFAAVFASSEPLEPEEFPETYLHPERFDPLGYDVRAGLLALPRPPDAPALVAALGDDLSSLAGESTRDGRLDAAAFAWRLRGARSGYELLDRDGVSLLRPQDAARAEAELADREALGRELRRVVAHRAFDVRSRCLIHAALYTGRAPVSPDANYVWPLGRVFGWVVNDPPCGAMALGGFAESAGAADIDAAAPPFDRLVRDGATKGWLRFEGPPGASELDRAPSSVLAVLTGARLACAMAKTPVAERYGSMTEAEAAKMGFSAQEPEALGAQALFGWGAAFKRFPAALQTERERQRIIDGAFQDQRYTVGRRETFSVEVRLRNGLHARLDFPRNLVERRNLTFAELPPEMRAAILRGAKAMFDDPPPSTGGMVLPGTTTTGKP